MLPAHLQKVTEILAPVFSNRPVRKAIVFGSWARGSMSKKSDLDLVIVTETQKRFFDRFDDFVAIYDALKGMAVDILIYTPEEFEAISHRAFIKTILKEGWTIYEH